MKNHLIESAILYFNGKIAYHEANVKVYLDNPAGIGEHPDIMEAIEGELEKIAEYEDKRDVIIRMRDDLSKEKTLFE